MLFIDFIDLHLILSWKANDDKPIFATLEGNDDDNQSPRSMRPSILELDPVDSLRDGASKSFMRITHLRLFNIACCVHRFVVWPAGCKDAAKILHVRLLTSVSWVEYNLEA